MSKKAVFIALALSAFGIFLPTQPALAAWYDFLIGAVTFIPMTIIALVLALGVLLSSLLATFSGVVLKWVLDPQFIQLSYTNPANNPLIQIGLNITQPFANMILVLVLVFIALTTILRVAGYETKKLLPTFILVALLVNFSPVILGVIVDASNIVMNFFIQEITGGGRLVSQLKDLGATLYARVSWTTFKATDQIELVLELFVFIFINIALFLVLLLWAILFIARYIAIWFLVILSPLAFVCYILPATRRIWSLWWHQFISWVIIGVNAVFFLYLADQFATLPPPRVAPGTLGGAILPAIFPLAVYWAGLIIAWAKLPAEAAAIKGLTQRGGSWVRTKGWRGVKTWAEEKGGIREKVGEGLKGKSIPVLGRMPWLKEKTVLPGVRQIEKVAGVRVFLPEAVRRYAEFRPAVAAGTEEASTYSSKVIASRIAAGADYGVKAVGGMVELVNRGDMQDLFKAFMDKYKVANEADLYNKPAFRGKMARLLQLAIRAGKHNDILRGDPRLARYAFEQLPGYSAADLRQFAAPGATATEAEAVIKATVEARRAHIGHWEKEVTTDEEVVRAGLTKGTEFWSAIDTQVKQGQETALKTIDKIFSDFIDSRGLAHATRADINTAWGEWEREFQARFPGMKGYFEAERTDRRFTARGWRKGRYVAPGAPPTAPPPTGAPPTVTPTTPPRGRPGAGGAPPPSGVRLGIRPRPPRGRPGVGGAPYGRPTRRPRGRPGVGGP